MLFQWKDLMFSPNDVFVKRVGACLGGVWLIPKQDNPVLLVKG